jgi:hypothetical protein
MHGHVKRRGLPAPGSIPEALDMFRSEVRFYREIAPVIGVRGGPDRVRCGPVVTLRL